MEEYLGTTSAGYVSCIKINGKPILPPLIDEKRRAELLHYKSLAILAENKILDRKRHKNDRQSADSGVIVSGIDILSSLSSPHSLEVKRKTDQQSSKMSELETCSENDGYNNSNIFDILLSKDQEFDDATLNFLMNCCDEFCRNSFCDKPGSECVVASETNGSERSESVSYVETLSSERECPTSCLSVEVIEKSQTTNEIEHESKPSEKSRSCGSELEKMEIHCFDGDLMFCDGEHNNLAKFYSKEQFTDAVEKTFQTDGMPGKNGDVACSLSLKSPDLHLIPPSDKLATNKSVFGRSVFLPGSFVTLRARSDNEVCNTPFMESQDKFNSAGELFTVEGNYSNIELNDGVPCADHAFADATTVRETHSSANNTSEKGLERPVDSIVHQGLTSLSGPSSADSSNTVIHPQCPILNISQPSKEKIYDPSLYDGKDTIEIKNSGGIDHEIKITSNFQVDENTCISTDSKFATDPSVACDLRESQSEGSVSGDIEDSNSIDNSVAFSKQSFETPCISGSISASELDVCSTLSASIMVDASEHSKSTHEPQLVEKETHSSPPRLLRQNSYTLEAPSPALLAHLKVVRGQEDTSEEEKKYAKEDTNKSLKESGKGRRGWDLEKARSEWKSETVPRLFYAVPCKDSQAVRLTTEPQTPRRKTRGKTVSSLPGSNVSSPVKANPCHSSLENISPSGTQKSMYNRTKLFYSRQKSLEKTPKRSSYANQTPLTNAKKKSSYCVSHSELYRSNLNSHSKHIRTRSKSDLSEQKTLRKNVTVGRLSLQNVIGARHSGIPLIVNVHKRKPEEFNFGYSWQKAKPLASTLKNTLLSKSVEELFRSGSMASTLSESAKESESDYYGFSSYDRRFEEITVPDNLLQSCDGKSSNALVERGTQSTEISTADSISPRPDSMLQEIFQQMQHQHSHLMAQLLDRQRKEQEALATNFLNQQRLILQEMNIIRSPTTSSDSPNKSQCSEMHDSGTQISVGLEMPMENNLCLQPAESHLSNAVEIAAHSGTSLSNKYSNGSTPLDNLQLLHCEELQLPKENQEIVQKVENDVQKKFSTRSVSPRKQNAATIINAVVRGYLTRRLFKTDHVQGIIQTISETVQCALQLQRECPGDITSSDIELHKRLIQQLTAACYTLHDTFFALSTAERMLIIANDREKLLRNLQIRPSSSISSATRKYQQRKQQQQQQGSRTPRGRPSSRRSWWQSKSRASSGGRYEHSSNSNTKPKTQQGTRGSRRPWR